MEVCSSVILMLNYHLRAVSCLVLNLGEAKNNKKEEGSFPLILKCTRAFLLCRHLGENNFFDRRELLKLATRWLYSQEEERILVFQTNNHIKCKLKLFILQLIISSEVSLVCESYVGLKDPKMLILSKISYMCFCIGESGGAACGRRAE